MKLKILHKTTKIVVKSDLVNGVRVISNPHKSSSKSVSSRHLNLFNFTGDKKSSGTEELEVTSWHGHF